jgi:hypothetical protein
MIHHRDAEIAENAERINPTDAQATRTEIKDLPVFLIRVIREIRGPTRLFLCALRVSAVNSLGSRRLQFPIHVQLITQLHQVLAQLAQ